MLLVGPHPNVVPLEGLVAHPWAGAGVDHLLVAGLALPELDATLLQVRASSTRTAPLEALLHLQRTGGCQLRACSTGCQLPQLRLPPDVCCCPLPRAVPDLRAECARAGAAGRARDRGGRAAGPGEGCGCRHGARACTGEGPHLLCISHRYHPL
jgi:hypothetical protein